MTSTFGFDDSVNDMEQLIEEDGQFEIFDIQSVLTDDFLLRHLQVGSLDELSELTETDLSDNEVSDTSKLDIFISNRSQFDSFEALLDAALLEQFP